MTTSITEPSKLRRLSPWGVYGTGLVALLLTLLVVTHPGDALKASIFGLQLWFEVVLPALFPFFTLAEILMGLGVIRFLGVLLEPAMRPIFRIPGVGGFVVAIGLASGYPLGAKIAGQIRREGLCTDVEGERLISFANTADPLFMVGAVAISMFAMPEIGGVLVVSHYASVLLVGFLMRFHAGGRMGTPQERTPHGNLVSRGLQAMRDARLDDGRPIGQMFGDAVRSSLQSMLFIGGCIMMFSVFIQILTVSGAINGIVAALSFIVTPLGISSDLILAIIKGTVEITVGAEAASQAADASLVQKVVTASGIIAWSGMGVHAQVAAMVHGTGIRMTPYVLARFLHAVCAASMAALMMGPLQPVLGPLISPVFAPLATGGLGGFWARLSSSLWIVGGLILSGIALSAFVFLKRRVVGFWVR